VYLKLMFSVERPQGSITPSRCPGHYAATLLEVARDPKHLGADIGRVRLELTHNRLKILFWDTTGLWVCAKKLEKGRFHWPTAGDAQGKVVLSHEEFAMLLGGIDLGQARHRKWYRRPVAGESSDTRIPSLATACLSVRAKA